MRIVAIVLMMMFVFTQHVNAATEYYGYFGVSTVGETSNRYWANAGTGEHVFKTITIGGNGTATLRWYSWSGGQNVKEEGSRNLTFTSDNWQQTVSLPSSAQMVTITLNSGEEVFFIQATTTNPAASTVIFEYTVPTFPEPDPPDDPPYEPPPNGGGNDGGGSDGGGNDGGNNGGGNDGGGNDGGYNNGGGNGGETCDTCGVFACPGWSEYMYKLDDIKNAIPPPPDWNMVADTFYDRIIPRMIDDLEDMLGEAPRPPREPDFPRDLNTRRIEDDIPDFRDPRVQGFDLWDLEREAEEIPYREDTTGGFNIVNPLESLPSFDEMKQYMPAPSDAEAPIPEGSDPTPPEPPIFEEPTEPVTPIPTEGATAPVPSPSGQGSNKYYKNHPDAPDGSGGG